MYKNIPYFLRKVQRLVTAFLIIQIAGIYSKTNRKRSVKIGKPSGVAVIKVSKGAKIRNRYNQVPHLTEDTNGKVTNSQQTPQTRAKRSALSQQVTTKHIYINRRAQRHSKHKTEQKHKRSTKEDPPFSMLGSNEHKISISQNY